MAEVSMVCRMLAPKYNLLVGAVSCHTLDSLNTSNYKNLFKYIKKPVLTNIRLVPEVFH